MNKPWKLILVLAGIYLAGIVTGAVIDRHLLVGPKPGKEHRSTVAVEQWAPKHLQRIVEGVDLDAAQTEQIRPIIRRNMEELDRLRTYSRAETSEIFRRMEREIAEKLTPEQRAKYEQQNKENRERMKNDSRSGDRPKGDGPPPPPSTAPAEKSDRK